MAVWFGTRRSKVRILPPRPNSSKTYTHSHPDVGDIRSGAGSGILADRTRSAQRVRCISINRVSGLGVLAYFLIVRPRWCPSTLANREQKVVGRRIGQI
jgi:hypothetical protein